MKSHNENQNRCAIILAREFEASMSLLLVGRVPFEPSEVRVEPSPPEWERDARFKLEKVAAENLGAKVEFKLVRDVETRLAQYSKSKRTCGPI